MRKLIFFLTIAAATALPVAAGATAPGTKGQIAFRRFFDAGHQTGAIFLINPDGTGERQVTHPPTGEIDAQYGPPAFSPDGSKLIFTRSRRGHDMLWTVDLATGAERRLTPAGTANMATASTPRTDGSWPSATPWGRSSTTTSK